MFTTRSISLSIVAASITIAVDFAHATPITFDGFQWEPLGQAQLTVTPEGLEVSNIGSMGNDGVRLVVPDSLSFLGSTEAIHRTIFGSGLGAPSSPTGAFLRMSAYGTINGTPAQLINSLTATSIGSGGVNLKVDMSPIAPSSMAAYYYNNGVLVLTETGLPGIEYDIPNMETPNDWGTVNDMGEDFTWLTPIPIPTFGGGVINADDLVFVPVGSGVTFGGYSAMDFTGSQVNGFVIAAIPEPSSLSLFFLGIVLFYSYSRRRVNKSTALHTVTA